MTDLPEKIEIASGRTLSLRELDPGDMLDLIEAGGSAASGAAASTWLSYAQMICSVRAVDGVPVQMPATKDDIRDLARRIGNEGIMVLQSLFFTSDSQEEQGLDTAKN
ncbi:hypothetical protein [Asaia prunellae]|uniref:hypothetical protein n=1 Tax=Asaia prunellae TaxID=610245 RepID=UPI000472E72D|nr:hypothetical protein [Asaia prunellae]